MRAIDADALIDDLKHDVAMDQDSLDHEELTDSNRENIQFDKDCKQNAIDLLQHAPTIEPEPKWIPCSERMPEEETDVLVTRTFLGCKDGSYGWNNHIPPKTYVEVAKYFCGEWTALSDEYKAALSRHTDPIAWMPIPKPYKEG